MQRNVILKSHQHCRAATGARFFAARRCCDRVAGGTMPSLRKRLGDFGEQAAAAHLIRQGYRLLARKWRCAGGELDLVMQDEATLVFVEVRTRRSGATGSGEESVGRVKQGRLIALAYAYLE